MKKDQRIERINCRITKEEYDKLQRIRGNLSISQWIRERIYRARG